MSSTGRTGEIRLAVAVGLDAAEAVGLDERGRLLAKAHERSGGDLSESFDALLGALLRRGINPHRVTRLVIVVNDPVVRALQQREVARVAVIRIGLPLTVAVPPLAMWPSELRDAVCLGRVIVSGGAEADGRASGPLDEAALGAFLATVAGRAQAVAVTGLFSPVSSDQELIAADLVRRHLGTRVPVALSHETGSLGLLERENLTVLNAALVPAARAIVEAARAAMRRARLDAELFLARGDGSVMAAATAERFPALLLGTRLAGAMRGLWHLTGLDEAIVVHAEPRVISVGAAVHGTPRLARTPVQIAGVRVNLSRPERVTFAPPAELRLAAAVAHFAAELRSAQVAAVGPAVDTIPGRLEATGPVLHPEDGDVASAVGAAVAPVTGYAEQVCPDRGKERRRAFESARRLAATRAVDAGADPDALEIVELFTSLLIHDVTPAVRVSVLVSGPPI